MQVSKEANLIKLKDVKIRLCDSSHASNDLQTYLTRRKLLDRVESIIGIDDSLELFEWLYDNGVTSQMLFENILDRECDGNLDKLANVLIKLSEGLKRDNGLLIAIWSSDPLNHIKYLCDSVDSDKFKADKQPMQELMIMTRTPEQCKQTLDEKIYIIIGGFDSQFLLKNRLRGVLVDIADNKNNASEIFDYLIQYHFIGKQLVDLLHNYYSWDVKKFIQVLIHCSNQFLLNSTYLDINGAIHYMKFYSPYTEKLNGINQPKLKSDKELMQEFIDSL